MPSRFDTNANRYHGQQQNPEHHPVPPVLLIFITSARLFQPLTFLDELVPVLFQFRRTIGQMPLHFIQHSFGCGRLAAQIGKSHIRRFLVIGDKFLNLLDLGISGGIEIFQQRGRLLPVLAKFFFE
jgi:hypothetical protein